MELKGKILNKCLIKEPFMTQIIDTRILSPNHEHRPFSEHFEDRKLNQQSPFNFQA